MTEADITIGIPTLNRAELVEPLVRSCLSQTQSPLQIVVSDNASSDDTLARLAVIKDSRLKVICQSTNIGMIGNWNACLNESEGEWFVLLSDDDQIDPDYVENFRSAIALAADV